MYKCGGVEMGESESGGTGVPPVFSQKITRRNLPHWQLAGATFFLTWRCAAGIMLTESERDIVLAAIRYWDGIRWNVLAAVVMPDHVHVLACPLAKGDGFWDLSELIHSVKSYSAHQISMQRIQQGHGIMGRAPGSSFSVWQDERYDRWMRNDDEIAEKWEYIVGNPVKSGLVEHAEQYCWLYQKKTGETPVPPDKN